MNFMPKARIMDEAQVRRAINRIAHEIVERHEEDAGLVLVGIQRRGVTIARRLHAAILKSEGLDLPLGVLDITFYRDDLSTLGAAPQVNSTDLNFDITDKTIVLVDDVLYTGRTVRAALDELMDFGRPRAIRLAVLVDRGHREIPIRPDFVGKNVPTSRREVVKVMVEEFDGHEEVVVGQMAEEA